MLKNVYKHFEIFSFNPAVPIESIKKMSTSNREVQGQLSSAPRSPYTLWCCCAVPVLGVVVVVTSRVQGGWEELVGGGVVILLHLAPALPRVVHAAAHEPWTFSPLIHLDYRTFYIFFFIHLSYCRTFTKLPFRGSKRLQIKSCGSCIWKF